MKKFIYLLIVATVISFPALAQRKNIIKVDFHSPIFRTGILTYERVLGPSSSISFSALYTDQSEGLSNADYLTRFAFTPEYRYYLSKFDAPRGFYISGYLRYQWMKAESLNYYNSVGFPNSTYYTTKNLNTVGAGLALGLQEVFKERIAVDLFIGPVWNSGDKRPDLSHFNNTRPNEAFKPYVGYFIRSGVSVGFAF